VPRSALFNLDKILDLEISRATPFSPSEVLSGWYELPQQEQDDHKAVAHVIARKALPLGIIDKLSARGTRVDRVLVRDADGIPLPIDLKNSLAIAELPSARRWQRLCAGSACAAVALAITAVIVMLSRQAAELELLDRRLEAAEVEAKKVHVEIDAIESSSQRIVALRREKLSSPSLLALWAELTRLLPDSAWLTGISVRESTVTIDGTAQSAETLIAALDGSPLFEAVAFTGPVTKLPGGKLDRFTVTFNLSQPTATTGLAAR
jgi:general secretion pathway protein L